MKTISLLALLLLPTAASAQDFLLWKYEPLGPDDPNQHITYSLRNWSRAAGEDFLQAEYAWVYDDGLVVFTSGVWHNNPLSVFHFTTILGQQGGGAIVGASRFAPDWAAGLPDKFPSDEVLPAARKRK